jgi:alkylation response protein AidB-like acyl-CoA dehydrogenase
MQSTFFDSAERLFAQECTGAHIRQIESGGETTALWDALAGAGFSDALLPESVDGAGLALPDVWPILFCMGRHILPLPYGHTMLARAWLHQHGQVLVDGPITFSPFQVVSDARGLTAHAVNFGRVAQWVLAQQGKQVWLLPVGRAQIVPCGAYGSLDADLHWDTEVMQAASLGDWASDQFAELLALSLAVLIAGAADRVLEMTLAHANQRVQFGKPIGKFQALQQQISEVAELTFGARMASEMSCRSNTWQPAPMLAALAKCQTSQAVARISAVAHAVHGAIGVTQEFDLQLYTRRLNEWARAGGAETFWASVLGQQVLSSGVSSVDFIRCALFAEQAV